MKEKEASQFAKLLAEAQSNRPEEVPANWHTAQEIADSLGCSYSHATKQLRAGVSAGTVERQAYRIKTGARVYPVAHYKPK